MADSFSVFNPDDVYDVLRQEILTLSLEPGTLLSENTVSARFGISRTPVRSVFERLRSNGLIEVIPKKGTFIAPIDLDFAEQILYMRCKVEIAVFTELAMRSNDDIAVLLKSNLDQQKNSIDHGVIRDVFYGLDSRFHGICLEAVGRKRLWNMIDQMDAHYSRYRRLDYILSAKNDVFSILYKQHEQLADAILSHRTEELRYMVTTHMYGGLIRNGEKLSSEYGHFFKREGRTIDEILLNMKLQVQAARDELSSATKKH